MKTATHTFYTDKMMKHHYETEITQDEYSENDPREWDNLGTMVCKHNRYTLGDTDNPEQELIDAIRNSRRYCESWESSYTDAFRDFDNPQELLNTALELDVALILPLYLYDHSGITMNTTGYSCQWDSSQVGYIYITREKIRKEYDVKRISKQLLERVTGYLVGEVHTYDQYLTGDVWNYTITEYQEAKEHNDILVHGTPYEETGEIDSLSGIFGHAYAEEEAERTIKYMREAANKRWTEEAAQLKQLTQSTLKALIQNHVPLNIRARKMQEIRD